MTRISINGAGHAIVLALLVSGTAQAQQQRTIYGPDGGVSGRTTTSFGGVTTYYDATGRVTHRTTTNDSGTTIYDADGQTVGRVTTTKPVSK